MPLASGTRLGPYEIQAAIGAGGMGEVYKARDTRLDRSVAIKVLPAHVSADAERRARFEREAKTIAALNHPHICTLYDVGEAEDSTFLVMEYLEGETLAARLRRGPLPLGEVLACGAQMADALGAAHRRGIVHRDLKPANVMLTEAGVMLLDFGLAKLKPGRDEGGAGLSALTTEAPLTGDHQILGTVPYMAPEQLEGKAADVRSDVFALGCVLYEMLTGRRAFEGESQASVISAILTSEPAPLSTLKPLTPPLLDRLVRTCLAKKPEQRWDSARDVAEQLRAISEASGPMSVVAPGGTWWMRPRAILAGTAAVLAIVAAVAGGFLWAVANRRTPSPRASPQTTVPVRQSLAVIPFRVLGSDEQLRYIAVGVAEMLSSKLFQIKDKDLHVASTSDQEQAGSYTSAEEAGRKLGVSLIVDGTVQAAGNQLRLIVTLHDVQAQQRVWTEEFTGSREDLFTLQDRVYQQLVQALRIEPGAEALTRADTRPTQDLEAYDLYLKGRNALRQRQDPKQLRTAIDFFEQALKKDARFALAQAGLADASLYVYGETKDGFWAQRAQAAAQRARDLDDQLPEVHLSLGSAYAATGRPNEAVVELKRALEIAPNSDEVHRRLGTAYRALGRNEEAIKALLRAVEVNPYFWVNHNALGSTYMKMGDHEKALAEFRRVTELEPQNPVGYENIGATYFEQGRWEDCLPAFQKALSLQPHWLTYSNLGTAYFYLKRYAEAVQAFEKAAELSPNDAITLGNLADALRWSGQRGRAGEFYVKAIALAFEELQVNPRDATMLAVVALYYAKNGDTERALEFIRRAHGIDAKDVAITYYEGMVHALAGRDGPALDSIEKALAGGYSAREIAGDPELQRLSESPDFRRLLSRYAGRAKQEP